MNKFFKIEERGSTVMTEILAGLTIFITMAYVLAVQPSAIMGFGGDATFVDISGLVISRSALLVSCALVTGVICMFMGLYANIPVAISTAMGTNFILGSLVQSGKVSFGWIMAALLVSGLLFVIMSVTGVRKFIVEMIPGNLKIAMTVSVGFFIAMLGFQNTGLATYEGGLGLGDFKSPGVLLTLIAILLIGILHAYKVKGAILIGVLAATVIGIPMGVTKVPASLVALPSVSEYGNLV
ncbi:MAG TPA: NCS2 family permease, partial [Clostridiaceae bacterium]|nr:NCS2 family permease [Clostridiaceae bacterium]